MVSVAGQAQDGLLISGVKIDACARQLFESVWPTIRCIADGMCAPLAKEQDLRTGMHFGGQALAHAIDPCEPQSFRAASISTVCCRTLRGRARMRPYAGTGRPTALLLRHFQRPLGIQTHEFTHRVLLHLQQRHAGSRARLRHGRNRHQYG